ncbi:uncharacterized protein LOC125518348 isoform X2 [Triticum urartu]|uniref:uncharacterized protein LOC125518348 isoform X2 n=1 Tax=Triticum urartu TaxID=4572 RepID=UPI002043985A|nr:uncharacterized protein LOC125518348 isoform X2 [Triticum urartu]
MPPQSLMLVNGGGEVAGLDEKLHNGGGELVDLDSAVVVAVLRGDMGVDLVCYSELGSTSYRGCPRARQPSRSSCSSIELQMACHVVLISHCDSSSLVLQLQMFYMISADGPAAGGDLLT